MKDPSKITEEGNCSQWRQETAVESDTRLWWECTCTFTKLQIQMPSKVTQASTASLIFWYQFVSLCWFNVCDTNQFMPLIKAFNTSTKLPVLILWKTHPQLSIPSSLTLGSQSNFFNHHWILCHLFFWQSFLDHQRVKTGPYWNWPS